MTEADLKHEWEYRYRERLGMLCEDREPTPDERNMARRCANATILALSSEESDQE